MRDERTPSSVNERDNGVTDRVDPDDFGTAAMIVAGLPVPTVILDDCGRVVASNGSAREIINASPLFMDTQGRLRCSIPAVAERLAAVLKSRAGEAHALRIVDFGPHGDLVVRISRVTPAGGSPGARPLTVVCFASETAPAAEALTALEELYGLSRDEVAAAVAIYCGQRMGDFAVAYGIDIMTAHRLRERVMERLGAHRSVDVARRVSVACQIGSAVDTVVERAD